MNTVKDSTVGWMSAASFLTAIAVLGTVLSLAATTPPDEPSMSPFSSSAERGQEFFQEGLNRAYEGELEEAVRLFNRGARVDPTCASCLWGLSWALGSNLDGPVPGEREAEGRSALRRARAVRDAGTARDRALIDALGVRYDVDVHPTSQGRRVAYAEAMRALAFEFPADADVQTLFAYALLSAHTESHYRPDGRAKDGVSAAADAAHRAMSLDRAHVGARSVLDHLLIDRTAMR